MALDGPNPDLSLIYGPAGVPAPAGLFFGALPEFIRDVNYNC